MKPTAIEIIKPGDKKVMRAYRLSTVEIQKLARIANHMDVKMTKVIGSLISWFWNEYMPTEQVPQPVQPAELAAIVNRLVKSQPKKRRQN